MTEAQPKTIHDAAYQVLIECLKAARQDARVTQVDLAARLGVDQSYVSKYERCERRLDVIELRAVCRALNIELGKFIQTFERELGERKLA